MRVNRTYNLALLVPFLTTLLLCYFFLFGLFFQTLVYGVFDLNYLKYAGLPDFFISMFRIGGMLIVVVLKIWIAYAVLIALVFGIWLLVRMILITSHKHLKFKTRMKIIGLSLGIFALNFLHMFVVLLPKRNRSHPSQLLVGREHLVRRLLHHKRNFTPMSGPDPRQMASRFYQRFVAVATFNNHRFFVTLLLLALTSAGSVIYAGHDARDMRTCLTKAAGKGEVPPLANAASLYPGLNISSLCQDGLDNQPDDVSIAGKFSESMSGFFNFPVVLLKKGSAVTPVLYLGATSRFGLFFNGKTRLPFAVPTDNLGPLFNQPAMSGTGLADDGGFAEITDKLALIEAVAKEHGQSIRRLEEMQAKGKAVDLAPLARKLALLEARADASSAEFKSLESGLGRIAQSLKEVERDHTSRIVSTVPAYCWATKPDLVVGFGSGEIRVYDAAIADKIRRLAYEYGEAGSRFIVISGHSDPSGASFDNYLLSRKRAEGVEALMLRAGLERSALYMVAKGENGNSNGPRRRVEIRDCSLHHRGTTSDAVQTTGHKAS